MAPLGTVARLARLGGGACHAVAPVMGAAGELRFAPERATPPRLCSSAGRVGVLPLEHALVFP